MDGLLLIGFVGLLIAAGYVLALYRLRRERQRLSELRQMVHGEMVAMYQVHRIHDAFLETREALRRSRTVRVPPVDRERRSS